MSALFSQTNLFLCGMQGNNGLLAKTLKKNPKSPIQPAGSLILLTGAKFAVRAVIFDEHNKEFIVFILFLMASLCVIFKSV